MAYHYTESGLDNVWLVNGYTVHDTPYGEGVSIQDSDGLHKAIGRQLIASPKPLNGAELRFIRIEMDLTQRRLATLLGAEEQSVKRWEKARTKPVPGPADRALRALYAEHIGYGHSFWEIVERLEQLDTVESETMRLKETDAGWQPAKAA